MGLGVVSPLKSAKRRPYDKGWTPGMAARGEARQDVELPTAGSRSGGERSAKHRFLRGHGIDKGPWWPPYPVHEFLCRTIHFT